MNTAVAALRASLDALAPTRQPAGPAWATGIATLDRALGGGVPRGRLTEIVGPRAAGRTTLARRVVAQVLDAGRWVAIIDATRTLAPQSWAGLGERLVVIRPHTPDRATWCADRLLRSGVFSLVVLDGAPLVPRPITFRLSQLARDRDATLLVVGIGQRATAGGSGIRLRVLSSRTVAIDKGAPPARAEVPRVVALTARLPDPLTDHRGADRRGAATRSRRPWTPAATGGAAGASAPAARPGTPA